MTIKLTNAKALLFLVLILVSSVNELFAQCAGVTPSLYAPVTSYCQGPASVTITNTSTGVNSNNGTRFYYFYSGASRVNVTDSSFTMGFPASGIQLTLSVPFTYNFKLVVVDGLGCRDSFVLPIVIHPPVGGNNTTISGNDGDGDATYCVVPGDPRTQDDVTFSVTSPNGTSFTWDFGDGSPTVTNASTAPFIHSYTSPGVYNVRMHTVGSGGCTDDDSLTVTYLKDYAANIATNQKTGCAPFVFTATNTSTPLFSSYEWDFGDGTPKVSVTNVNPINHTYNAVGTFTVTMKATNACGFDIANIYNVQVIRGARAGFSTNLINNSGCAPQTVIFTDTSKYVPTTGLTPFYYFWDLGNGQQYTYTTASPKNPPNQIYAVGTYNVMLVANSFCGSDTARKIITIRQAPVATFTSTISGTCSPVTINNIVNTSTGGGLTYAWKQDATSLGTASTFTSATVTATGTTPVTSIIRLDVTNNCGTDSETVKLTANPPVKALYTASSNSICKGSSVTITNNNSTGTNLVYTWSFGNGNTASTAGPFTQTYNAAGKDTIKLYLSGTCGKDTLKIPINVKPFPDAKLSTPDTNVCPFVPVHLTNSTNAGVAATYSWSFGSSANPATYSGQTPGVIKYNNSGTYYVKLTADSAGCTNTDSVKITVKPKPFPIITASTISACSPQIISFTNTSANNAGDLYLWNFGNGVTHNGYNPPVTPLTFQAISDSVFKPYLTIISGTGCRDSSVISIVIHPYAKPNFTLSTDTICANQEVQMQNTSTGTPYIKWDFGDGTSSPLNAPSKTYTTPGKYYIALACTTNYGCINNKKDSVLVLPNPTAAYTSTTVCEKDSTVFNATTSLNAVSYVWHFDDIGSGVSNTSILATPKHLFTITNAQYNYAVKLVVENSVGCYDSISSTVTVNPKPYAGFTSNVVCAGQVVNFIDTSTHNPTIWKWDFGEPSSGAANTSVLTNPSHTYPKNGPTQYNVKLVTENAYGCKDSLLTLLNVYPVPVADFTVDTSCVFSPVQFTNLTATLAGTTNNYFWNFGDSKSSLQSDPIYVYQTNGPFNAVLTSYNSYGCSDSITKVIFIKRTPIAGFTTDTVCLGLANTFTDTVANNATNTSWTWTFGDGAIGSQGPVTTHAYADSGVYTVSVEVMDNSSHCSTQTFRYVRVNKVAYAGMIKPDTICEGSPVSFKDNSITNPGLIASYSWHFGNGDSSTQKDPIYTYNAPGIYKDSLIVTTVAGCKDLKIDTIVVNPLPKPDFAYFNGCAEKSTQFSDSTTLAYGNINSWAWTFGDGPLINNNQNPTHSYQNDGLYAVTLKVTSDKQCVGSVQKAVTIHPNPNAQFTNNISCFNDSTLFTNTSTINSGVIDSVYWDLNDGTSDTSLVQFYHQFQTSRDSFSVTLYTISDFGCRDTVTQVVTTYPLVHFSTRTENGSGCQPFNVQLYDSSTIKAGSWIAYKEWTLGDGTKSLENNPTHLYIEDGSYKVTLTVQTSDGCKFTDTLKYPVIVYPKPVADFYTDYYETDVSNANMVFVDASRGAAYWTWTFGDVTHTISTDQNPSYIFPDSGTYDVQLWVKDNYNCVDSIIKKIRVNGLYAFYIPNSFTPNNDGVNDIFYGYGYGVNDFRLEIFSRFGDRIFDSNSITKGWDGTLDDGSQASVGVYNFKVTINNGDKEKERVIIRDVTLVR